MPRTLAQRKDGSYYIDESEPKDPVTEPLLET